MKNREKVPPNDVAAAMSDRSPRLDVDDRPNPSPTAVRDVRRHDAGHLTHRAADSLYALCGRAVRRDEFTHAEPTCGACLAVIHADDDRTGEEIFGGPEIHQPARVLPIVRVAVASSNVKSLGYDNGTLHVEFKSGAVHAYYKVPADAFEALVDAPSIGKHYAAYIRGQFRSEKLLDAPRPSPQGFVESQDGAR
jgi:hypothetical protein